LLIATCDSAGAAPVRDDRVQALARVLAAQHGFEVRVLPCAQQTRTGIVSALVEWSAPADADDAILVVYLGPGIVDPEARQGYWLPADAATAGRAAWIPVASLRDWAGTVPTRRMLLASEACTPDGAAPGVPPRRCVFSFGDTEPVADPGALARRLFPGPDGIPDGGAGFDDAIAETRSRWTATEPSLAGWEMGDPLIAWIQGLSSPGAPADPSLVFSWDPGALEPPVVAPPSSETTEAVTVPPPVPVPAAPPGPKWGDPLFTPRQEVFVGAGVVLVGGASLVASTVLDQRFMETERLAAAEDLYRANHVTYWAGWAVGSLGAGLAVDALIRWVR